MPNTKSSTGLRRRDGQRHRQALARRVHVARTVAVVEQADLGDLDLARAPAALAIAVTHVLPGCFWRLFGRVPRRPAVLMCEERLLAAGDVREIGVDHALGVALVGAAALLQPQHVVAHLLDETEAVRDQHDRLPRAA
jgi:hypothetical protein